MSVTEDVMEEPPEPAEAYEHSVGDVMTAEYVAVTEETTIGEAIQVFTPEDPTQTSVYYIYATDDNGRLVGIASLRELLGQPKAIQFLPS